MKAVKAVAKTAIFLPFAVIMFDVIGDLNFDIKTKFGLFAVVVFAPLWEEGYKALFGARGGVFFAVLEFAARSTTQTVWSIIPALLHIASGWLYGKDPKSGSANTVVDSYVFCVAVHMGWNTLMYVILSYSR